MAKIIFFLILMLNQCCLAADNYKKQLNIINAKVGIAQLVARDQTVRLEFLKLMSNGKLDPALVRYLRQVDEENSREFLKIIHHYGLEVFDRKGIAGIWLLTQHADHDRPLQKEMLRYFKTVSAHNPCELKHYAYLYDRVQMHLHLPQRYGTQGHCVGKHQWTPFAIENKKGLSLLRRSVGLPSFEYYQKVMNQFCS